MIVALAVVACRAAIAVPPDDAPAAVVLDTYLHALTAGDCATANRLTVAGFGPENGDPCGSTDVTSYRINDPPAAPSDRELVFATNLVTSGSRDGSIEAGEIRWFYSLTRQPSGAWRVTGGGTGP